MKKTIAVLKYIVSVHVFALFMLALIRVILYFANRGVVGEVPGQLGMFFTAMLKGVWFDNTMSCYVIALPLFVLLVFSIFYKIPRIAVTIFNVYFIILYSIIAGFAIADIPYYLYNQAHLGGTIFQWFAFGGDTAAMIFQEKSYYLYLALFVFIIAAIGFVISFFSRKLKNAKFQSVSNMRCVSSTVLSLLSFTICFAGIRGTFAGLPLRVSDAYFVIILFSIKWV